MFLWSSISVSVIREDLKQYVLACIIYEAVRRRMLEHIINNFRGLEVEDINYLLADVLVK